MKLLLIRHPPTDIGTGICYGRLDVAPQPNSPAVTEIVDAIRRHGIGVIWSSPAARCLIPAQAAATAVGAKLRIDDRLQELDFGLWEGVPWDDISWAQLDDWAADPLGFAPPGGEKGAALMGRVEEFHRGLVAAVEDCAVISHGGPLRVLQALARGEAPDLLAPSLPFGTVLCLNC